jgi:glycosyltransferase involved in cell wall biosynthesis
VDTFPSSVLEALACGIPVVATAVGGIPEQVEDSQTGFLVPAGKAEDMAIRVTQLLQHHDLRKKMQQQATRSARHQFNFEHQVSAYLDWYHALAKENLVDKIS